MTPPRRTNRKPSAGRTSSSSPYPRPLVLASGSPRRAALLAAAGYRFTVIPSPVDEPEKRPASIPLLEWPMALAYLKATAVQLGLPPGEQTILAADTIVLLNRTIINKPRDRAQAARILRQLAGKTHTVITGLVLLRGRQQIIRSAAATVRIAPRTAQEWNAYLDSDHWVGKAGGYGIQDNHGPWIKLVSGSRDTVIGLPCKLLARSLSALDRQS